MLSSIVAALIAVWYYFSAKKTGRDPINWAIAGLVIYFIVALSWTWFITPSIKDAAIHSQSKLLMYITRYGFIVIASACAVLYNLKFAAKKQD